MGQVRSERATARGKEGGKEAGGEGEIHIKRKRQRVEEDGRNGEIGFVCVCTAALLWTHWHVCLWRLIWWAGQMRGSQPRWRSNRLG